MILETAVDHLKAQGRYRKSVMNSDFPAAELLPP